MAFQVIVVPVRVFGVFFFYSDFFFSDAKMTLFYEMIVPGGKFLWPFVLDSLVLS